MFVKTSEFTPNVAPQHEESAGGLLDLLRGANVQIRATVVPVHGVVRPETIQE
jgi:hypothetical protein